MQNIRIWRRHTSVPLDYPNFLPKAKRRYSMELKQAKEDNLKNAKDVETFKMEHKRQQAEFNALRTKVKSKYA